MTHLSLKLTPEDSVPFQLHSPIKVFVELDAIIAASPLPSPYVCHFTRVAWVKEPKFSTSRSRVARREIQAAPASSHRAPAGSFVNYKYKDLKTERRG